MSRVASVVASVASRVCGTWHMAALRASVDRQSHTSASTQTLVYVSGAPLFRIDMFLATPQPVATLYFLCPAQPAASILYFPALYDTLYFPAPHNQRRAFFIAPCDERRAEGGCRNITDHVERKRDTSERTLCQDPASTSLF